jgi:ligand-binding SRPBCC domain-containing protein
MLNPVSMQKIHLTNFIASPLERVFDLSRHLSIYKNVFNGRTENFISGSGLLNKGDTLTIQVKHFGKPRSVNLRVAGLEKGILYSEEQVKGDLQFYKHDHHFKQVENGTIMIDLVEFGLPKDPIGKLAGRFYLRRYIENIVQRRNRLIKQYAESEKWKALM